LSSRTTTDRDADTTLESARASPSNAYAANDVRPCPYVVNAVGTAISPRWNFVRRSIFPHCAVSASTNDFHNAFCFPTW
jgi:hypothetical protein